MKRLTTVLLSAMMASTLAACGAGASGAGVAARIGPDVIHVDELESSVGDALAERPSQDNAARVQATRSVLGRMINSLVYEAGARELDVDVTADDVEERLTALEAQFGGPEGLIQQAKGIGIPVSAIAEVVRGELLREAIGDALVRELAPTEEQVRGLDSADVAHILVKDRPAAVKIIDQLKKGGDFAALAKKFSTDPGSKDQGGVYAGTRRGQFVPAFDKAVWSGKVGAIQGPVETEFGFHVIKVVTRVEKTLSKLTPQERSQVLSGQRDTVLAEFLAKLSDRLDISVNPRFGVWNAEAGRLEPPEDDLSEPKAGPPSPGGLPLDPNGQPADPNGQPANPNAPPSAPAG